MTCLAASSPRTVGKDRSRLLLMLPTEERQARINPLGLYVTAASWAKRSVIQTHKENDMYRRILFAGLGPL